MPMVKICDFCHTAVPIGEVCKCRHRRYGTPSKDDIRVYYQSQEWRRVREFAIRRTFGLDILSLLDDGVIRRGDVVHHITPIKVDYSMRDDVNNLIYLTNDNHQKIHKMYENNFQKASKHLYQLLANFQRAYVEGW